MKRSRSPEGSPCQYHAWKDKYDTTRKNNKCPDMTRWSDDVSEAWTELMKVHGSESGGCRQQSAAYIKDLEKRCGTYDRIVSSTGAVVLIPKQRGINGLRQNMIDVDTNDDMVHMPLILESFMDATHLRRIGTLWRKLVEKGDDESPFSGPGDDDVCDVLQLAHYLMVPNRDLRDIVAIWWKRVIESAGNWWERVIESAGSRQENLLRRGRNIAGEVLGMDEQYLMDHLEEVMSLRGNDVQMLLTNTMREYNAADSRVFLLANHPGVRINEPLVTLLTSMRENCDGSIYRSDNLTQLHVATLRKNAQHVAILLAAGALVDSRTGDRPIGGCVFDPIPHAGSTALHVACRAGATEVVDVLLANGASTSIQTGPGATAASLAVDREPPAWRVIRQLQDYGVVLDAQAVDRLQAHVSGSNQIKQDIMEKQRHNVSLRDESRRRLQGEEDDSSSIYSDYSDYLPGSLLP